MIMRHIEVKRKDRNEEACKGGLGRDGREKEKDGKGKGKRDNKGMRRKWRRKE